ncbi:MULTISPECIES: hypothetical protein [unclassified Streptomyces]|uniref:hypothetical protein n=1 Tax=unclassified Streptomyces TaxID=2593676 RepID=UPI0037ACC5D2
MRRTRAHRRAAALAAAAVVPLLGGCGIQETDVIEAGGPATVEAFFNRNDDMILFFRAPTGGLNPVIRSARPSPGFGEGYDEVGSEDRKSGDQAGPVSTEQAVLALLGGTAKEDRAVGLSTALPAARPGAAVELAVAPDGTVTLRLPFALKPLEPTALRQLTCTVAYSQEADGQVVVELEGEDGASSSDTCGLALGGSGAPDGG